MIRNLFIILAYISTISVICSQAPTAIIDFEAKGISQTEASTLTDRLCSELFKTGRFQVMERGLMEEILSEQGFQQTGCTSDECVVEVGKIIGVQQMIGGSIGKVGNVFSISARIVSVETGEILKMATYDYEGSISGLLTEGMREVAAVIAGERVSKAPSILGGVGTFYIATEPSGASIWVDDVKYEGVTPLLIDNQSAREHKIYVEKGELSALSTERAEANIVRRINLILGVAKGGINVFSVPMEAQVFVDGEVAGVTPLTVDNLTVGEHKLEIEKPDYVRHTEIVSVRRNELKRLDVHLEKMPLLMVFTNPPGANLSIDGKNVGATSSRKVQYSPKAYKLSPGEHDISISKPDYEVYEAVIKLSPGEVEKISYSLVRESGSIDVSTAPSGAIIYLNGIIKGNSPLTLSDVPTGSYQVRTSLEGYLPSEEDIEVQYKKSRKVEISLTSVATVRNQIIAIKKKRNLWTGLALVSSGISGYYKYSSYARYQDYKIATSEARTLHEMINRENAIYPVAFGVGAACALPVIYYHFKKKNLEKNLNLSFAD